PGEGRRAPRRTGIHARRHARCAAAPGACVSGGRPRGGRPSDGHVLRYGGTIEESPERPREQRKGGIRRVADESRGVPAEGSLSLIAARECRRGCLPRSPPGEAMCGALPVV